MSAKREVHVMNTPLAAWLKFFGAERRSYCNGVLALALEGCGDTVGTGQRGQEGSITICKHASLCST